MWVKESILVESTRQSNLIEGIPATKGKYHNLLLEATRKVVQNPQEYLADVEALHTLFEGILDDEAAAGCYRTVKAYVGNQCFPKPEAIPALMAEWYAVVSSLTLNPIGPGQDENILSSMIWDLHHHFVCIHPFADGNGRMARILLNVLRFVCGLPWFVIYSNEREAYFREIREFEQSIFIPDHRWAYDAEE